MGSYRTYSIPGKLQPWFLRLLWKTFLRQNCRLGSCACTEGPDLGQKTLMMMMMTMFHSRGLKLLQVKYESFDCGLIQVFFDSCFQ